jgi:hypothetical protein
MKPGSKAYFIIMRRIYWFSVAVTVMGIPPLVISFAEKTAPWDDLNTSAFPTLGLLIIGIVHLLSAFEPIAEKPRWEKVFPELKDSEANRPI